MKKSIKLMLLFAITIVSMFVGREVVLAADNAPSSFTVSHYNMNSKPFGLTQDLYFKKTNTGRFIYCLQATKKLPTSSVNYTKSNLIYDRGTAYIIESGYDDKTETDYFITQSALWIYLMDTNQMSDSSNGYVKNIKNAVYGNTYYNNSIAKAIRSLVSNAKNGNYNNTNDVKLEFTTTNVTFTLRNGVYTSNTIKVNTNLNNNDYSVTLYNQPTGTKVNKTTGGFYLTIPEYNVKNGYNNFSINISYNGTKYNTYRYTPNNSNYQILGVSYAETVTYSDQLVTSINREYDYEDDVTTIVISKQDITTGYELAGATLVIKDRYGDVVERWVSTRYPKEFDNLEPGTYTLEEIYAPDGYELSDETLTFRVREDGKTTRVVMYNSPEEFDETVVSISKQDITTGYELAGATLVIKDHYGNIVEKWVSDGEAYIIRGLEEGTYTLEETVAPDGYVLSSETITFKVKDNGVVTEVVMYNTPESNDVIFVPSTGTFASKIPYIFGGLIIIIGSVLIYRNVKKEQ